MMSLKSVFLVFNLAMLGIAQHNCPANLTEENFCDMNKKCKDSLICTNVKEKVFQCCDWSTTHCPETGLHAFPKIVNHVVYWRLDEDLKKEGWYRKEVGSITSACPIPKAFIFSEVDVVPHGFHQTSGSSAKNCSSHSDCSHHEFCGTTFNPSYCYSPEKDSQFDNKCFDKSGVNGTSLQFCYPSPSNGTDFEVVKKSPVDLHLCNNDTDCQQNRFCSKVGGMRKMEDGKPKTWSGVCVIPMFCESDNHKTAAVRTPDGEFCEGGAECNEKAGGYCERGLCCYSQAVDDLKRTCLWSQMVVVVSIIIIFVGIETAAYRIWMRNRRWVDFKEEEYIEQYKKACAEYDKAMAQVGKVRDAKLAKYKDLKLNKKKCPEPLRHFPESRGTYEQPDVDDSEK